MNQSGGSTQAQAGNEDNSAGESFQVLVNDRINPVNIEPYTIPTLRWRYTDDFSYDLQPHAYQIIVADRPDINSLAPHRWPDANAAAGVKWNSGIVEGDGFSGVSLNHVPMNPAQRYWAKVYVYDANEVCIARSSVATFGTGPGHHWCVGKAIWSAPQQCAEAEPSLDDWACLRTVIELPDSPIRWASLSVTASSTCPSRQFVYRVWANGQFLGCGPVFPIDGEHRYEGYDVTGLLKSGERNAISAIVYTQEDHRFAAQLDVCLNNGQMLHYGSDSTWKAQSLGEVFAPTQSIGSQYYWAPNENIQASSYPSQASLPNYDDSDWPAAQERQAFARLVASPLAGLAVERYQPQSVRWLNPNRAVLDCGQSRMGGLALKVDLHSSIDLDIRYGEVLEPSGQVRYQLNTSNCYRENWHLQEGENQLETWGIRVFRYVELSVAGVHSSAVDDLARVVKQVEIAALEPERTSLSADFQSSDQLLNDIWKLSSNTIDNLSANIYVDSWTRERAPYEADAYIHQRAHMALDDAPALGRYTLDYLAANRTWPTEWPLYTIMAIHDSWGHSGSLEQVRAGYQRLCALLPERYIDPESGLLVKDPGQSSSFDGDIVDWPEAERDGFVFGRVNTVINCLASQAYADMAQIARALGHDGDARLFGTRSQAMRSSIHARLYDPEAGAYYDGLDTGSKGAPIQHHAAHSSIFALAFARVPIARMHDLGDFLRKKGMPCSVYTAAIYISGLYQAGFGADALELIKATSGLRTWEHMLDLGAGATMEAWDPSLKPNTTYSHPWAASPAYLMPHGLMGLKALDPGWRRFSFIPQPGSVREASVVLPSHGGDIEASYRLSGPAQVEAGRIFVPGMSARVKVPPRQEVFPVLPAMLNLEPGQLALFEIDGELMQQASVQEPFMLANTICWPGSFPLPPLAAGEHTIRMRRL
ncbi:hypothetical protein KIMH_13090 [Bombiscardovia apis]|uniref:alpha-L-rhamnosidase n=1 Tax=Bombiscardovia apis TaxID=2932182 RepID=A0ABM8BE78_9BIFI|nr:family 78 glycoside hydrolase catalytic domain [Bombiscardovia apis]BDR55198.1 hypothetical protein KIMH_13090 [Bombiscardovia apis]